MCNERTRSGPCLFMHPIDLSGPVGGDPRPARSPRPLSPPQARAQAAHAKRARPLPLDGAPRFCAQKCHQNGPVRRKSLLQQVANFLRIPGFPEKARPFCARKSGAIPALSQSWVTWLAAKPMAMVGRRWLAQVLVLGGYPRKRARQCGIEARSACTPSARKLTWVASPTNLPGTGSACCDLQGWLAALSPSISPSRGRVDPGPALPELASIDRGPP